MNTGIQRSSTTPLRAWTTTSPVGKTTQGKEQPAKNMPLIMAAHEVAYVATATVAYLEDYAKKLTRAMEIKGGLAYIHLHSPCVVGWRAPSESAINICRLAVETNYFPLWEYEGGEYRFTHTVDGPKPMTEYVKLMQKFSHLDEAGIAELQQLVNSRFDTIRSLTEITQRH
ncbi:MAG: NADH-dependent phenylglyoxylate dehydrogenase subunit beta [Dehalococcoidia bacterium]|nr:NADH-dependent phenylglyoxylate dehydrogenase subunit beta [Chloroflexota bacterium]